MATQRERSRALHFETRRDSGRRSATATHIAKQRQCLPFQQLKMGGRQQEAIVAQAYALLIRMKIISGGTTESMDALSLVLARRYTTCIPLSGVRKEMIWGDWAAIARQLGLFTVFKHQLLNGLKLSVEVEDLMVIFEQYGVKQDCARVLRIKYPGMFHSERQLAKCSDEEEKAAISICGEMIKYTNGYALEFEPTLVALYTWALSEHCHPEALDESVESTETIRKSAHNAIDLKIQKKIEHLIPEAELLELQTQQSRAQVAVEQTQLALELPTSGGSLALLESSLEESEHQLHTLSVEVKSQELLKSRIESMQHQQAKLKIKKEKADKIGMTAPLGKCHERNNKNILSIKERCLGEEILYRRLSKIVDKLLSQCEADEVFETFETLRPWFKGVLDGRQILRQFLKNKNSDQALLSVKAMDTGSRVNSRKVTVGIGCCDHGENGADDMMQAFCATVSKHMKDGVVIKEPVLAVGANGKPALVKGLRVKPRWTMCPDGAQEYKCCAEPCGPQAHRCCSLCYTLRDSGKNEKYSIGSAFTTYTIQDGDTLDNIFHKHDMDFDLGCCYNPDTATDDGRDQEEAWAELTLKDIHRSADDNRPSCTKPLSNWHPNLDPSKYDPHHVFKVEPESAPKQIRVRLVWEPARPLKQMWIDAGFTWDDFGFCATHCDMRMAEWLLYNGVRFSGKSETLVNAWFEKYGCNMKFKCESKRWQKTSFNGQNHVEKWFQTIDYEGVQMERWRAFVSYFDPDVDDPSAPDPSTIAVWETLIPLRDLYLCMYPTPEQQASIGVLTLQHFVAFRLRYKSKHVHHYLHKLFGHASRVMRMFKSIGLLRNESEEALNSEDKCYIQNHSKKGGCGSDMCFDVIRRHRRKIYRIVAQAFNIKKEGNKIIEL